MTIRINLDVMMAKRKIGVGELAEWHHALLGKRLSHAGDKRVLVVGGQCRLPYHESFHRPIASPIAFS